MADEKIILEIYVNTADAKKQIDELKATIEKQNEALTDTKKGTDAYGKLSSSIKENKESISNLTKIVKEQESAQRSLDKQRQQALTQMAKQEQKQRDLIAAANMEVKTDKDLEIKLNAMINLRKNIDKTTADGVAQYDAMTLAIKDLDKAVKENDASSGRYQRNVGNYAGAIETANMSLGEMKRTLRELRNMPLVGKTEAEIQQINATMGTLTDEIGDYGARLKSSGDKVSLMIEATQGFIAVSQMASGALAAFGYNTEKLEKAMVQLIGVSQALATIHQLNERHVLQNTIATIKDTYAKVANAVAAKGQALATTGATAATRIFGKALNSIPFVAILAAIIALAGGLALLVREALKETDAAKKSRYEKEAMIELNKQASSSIAEETTKIKALTAIAIDSTKTDIERKKALEGIKEETNGVINVTDLSAKSLERLTSETNKYIKVAELKAKQEAAMTLMTEEYKKQLETQAEEYSMSTIQYFLGTQLAAFEGGATLMDLFGDKNSEGTQKRLKKSLEAMEQTSDYFQGRFEKKQDESLNESKIKMEKYSKEYADTNTQLIDESFNTISVLASDFDYQMSFLNESQKKKISELKLAYLEEARVYIQAVFDKLTAQKLMNGTFIQEYIAAQKAILDLQAKTDAEIAKIAPPKPIINNGYKKVEAEKETVDKVIALNFEAAQRMDALSKGTYANYLDYLQNRQAADQSYYDYKKMLDDKATAEREKMETERSEAIKAGVKQTLDELAAAHAKEIEELKAYNELRRQLGLISDGQIYDEKLEALKGYLEKKFITEQEYDKLSRQLDNERQAAQIKSFQDKFQAAVEITNSLSALVQSSMDAELQTLEGNEEAQAEVRKKYADAIFATKISEMAVNGLMAITSIWATWGAYPPVAALLTGISLAATIPAIVKATAERNKMRGFADGGYTGDGSKYTPAGMVHKGEVVFSKEDVKLLGGVKKTDSLRPTSSSNMQYFTGGIVGFGNTSTAKNETNLAMVEAVKNLQIVATIEDINAGLSSEQNRMSISHI